jgi:hypothetical protein
MKPAALLIPLMLAACAPAGTKTEPSAPSAAEAPPNPYALDINLALTPRTIEKLKADKESITVSVMYFGVPASEDAPGVDKDVNEVGLGSDQIDVAPDVVHVKAPGTGFDPKNLASIKDAPEVLVNVYSARKASEDNVLDCDIYQGPVAMAQKKPIEIHCDLLMTFKPADNESPVANPLEQ